jgi:restriction system protein
MQLTITSIDYALEDLYDQVPIVVDLIRQLPGDDRPDYWIGAPQVPEFRTRSRTSADVDATPDINQDEERTPEEYIEYGYSRLHAALADEILSRIAQMPPASFEKLVVDLLVAMGYGGSQRRRRPRGWSRRR